MRIGWKFRRIPANAILSETATRQCPSSNGHLGLHPNSPGKPFLLESAIRRAGGALPLSSAAEIAGSAQVIYALIVQRHLRCNLRIKIDGDTPIMMVDHAALRRCSTPVL